jgi:hypothetical protein
MIRKILWSMVVLIAFLGCLEGIAQMFPIAAPPTPQIGMQLQPHPSRIWSMRPGTQQQFGATVTIDNLGMRSTEVNPTSKRWLTLGDSSIFGHGLSDDGTLHHQLEEALRGAGFDIDVLCGATPGYSSVQSLDYLNEIGWDLQPDVIVLGNLWSDNNFDHFQDHVWMDTLSSPSNRIIRVLKSSSLLMHTSKILRPDLWTVDNTLSANPHTKVSWIREPYAKGTRRVPLPLYIHTISTILEEASKRNIEVIVMQPANRHRLDIVDVEVTWDPYFKAQTAVADHYNVPTIDVAPILRAFGLSKSQAFLDQMHPTAQANYWIAQSILDLWKNRVTENQAWLPKNTSPPSLEIPDRWTSE